MRSPQQHTVPIRTPKQIAGHRAACALGRDILDAAHRAVRPGVTTDEIDRVRLSSQLATVRVAAFAKIAVVPHVQRCNLLRSTVCVTTTLHIAHPYICGFAASYVSTS